MTGPTTDELFSVAGRSVVITGAARGIGQALALGFAQRGCRIFVLDVHQDEAERCVRELRAAHPGCPGAEAVACDVRDAAQVHSAAGAVASALLRAGSGPLDVLVNCAGVTRRLPAEDFPLDEFDRIHSTNLRGAWCASREFGHLMLQGGVGGCIINIDSFVTSSPLKHVTPYAMSKAGVQALTRGLAVEWGPRGIRVNGLAPGLILTPISAALWSQAHMRQWAAEQTPLGRMGDAEDLVGAAVFLASPAARFITGQTLRVDGGLSAGMHWPIDAPLPDTGPPTTASRPAMGGASDNRMLHARGFATQTQPAPTLHARAQMHYVAGTLVANPFERDGVKVNKEAGVVVEVTHDVWNGRHEAELVCDSGASLKKRGFALLQSASSVRDFRDDGEVIEKYYPELLAEASRLTGTSRCMVVSHVLRKVGSPLASPSDSPARVRSGAFMVHGDFNDGLRDQLLEMIENGRRCVLGEGGLGLTLSEARTGRLVVLNFWRPLCREPVQRAPLAVCDASSLRAEDLRVYAHHPCPPPENYRLPLPNLLTVAASSPEHRWYTFPGMTRDEWLVFKTYDSSSPQPSNGVGVHTAFEQFGEQDAPARESIEARVVCFLPDTGAGIVEQCGGEDATSGAKWQRGAEELSRVRPPMENVERIAFYRWLEQEPCKAWDGPVGLTAKFTVPVAKLEVFLDIMRENIAGTRLEEGVVQYDLVPNFELGAAGAGVEVYWLLERFASRRHLRAHVESEHYKRCQERFVSDMGGHPLVQIGLYRIDPVEPKPAG